MIVVIFWKVRLSSEAQTSAPPQLGSAAPLEPPEAPSQISAVLPVRPGGGSKISGVLTESATTPALIEPPPLAPVGLAAGVATPCGISSAVTLNLPLSSSSMLTMRTG